MTGLPRSGRFDVPLWALPAAVAALLVVAVHLALWLSIRDGHVPACVPYLEGCTSISRAARHGLGNHVFRLLVLPCTALLALHWWASAGWLAMHGRVRGTRLLLALGLLAAVALAVYATFLGSDGAGYRFMRRYGVVVYFGASYVAQLQFLRLGRASGALPRRGSAALLACCLLMLVPGLGSVATSALVVDPLLKDRLENLLEWHLATLLAAWYVLQAGVWWRVGGRVRLAAGEGG